jgi:hypothetical protein
MTRCLAPLKTTVDDMPDLRTRAVFYESEGGEGEA